MQYVHQSIDETKLVIMVEVALLLPHSLPSGQIVGHQRVPVEDLVAVAVVDAHGDERPAVADVDRQSKRQRHPSAVAAEFEGCSQWTLLRSEGMDPADVNDSRGIVSA